MAPGPVRRGYWRASESIGQPASLLSLFPDNHTRQIPNILGRKLPARTTYRHEGHDL